MGEKICCGKIKHRTDKEIKDLITRLSRIEGQIRGIRKMVEEDAYCTDIIIQASAASAALNSFNKELLKVSRAEIPYSCTSARTSFGS